MTGTTPASDAELIRFVVSAANDLTVVALLIFCLVGVLKGWWVPRWVYLEKVRSEEEYKAMVRGSLPVAREATKVATEVVSVLKSKDGGDV